MFPVAFSGVLVCISMDLHGSALILLPWILNQIRVERIRIQVQEQENLPKDQLNLISGLSRRLFDPRRYVL
jgi:hypothetical protein